VPTRESQSLLTPESVLVLAVRLAISLGRQNLRRKKEKEEKRIEKKKKVFLWEIPISDCARVRGERPFDKNGQRRWRCICQQ